MRKIVVDASSREKRYAVLEGIDLVRLEVVKPNQVSRVGSIYLGKVTKVLPGMEAVFVDYGENKNGFLHRDELPAFQRAKANGEMAQGINHYVHQGEKLLVQVKQDETGTKGARLTALIEISSPSLVYIYGLDYIGVSKKITQQQQWREIAQQYKQADEGVIIRTAMEKETEAFFSRTLTELKERYLELERKGKALKNPGVVYEQDLLYRLLVEDIGKFAAGHVVVNESSLYRKLMKLLQSKEDWSVQLYQGSENVFSAYQLDTSIEKALKRIVWLDNGSYLIFEETEALTVIDVNTGKFTGKCDKGETYLRTNITAAKEVARQLRLRNLSGMILIDFINMKKNAHKQAVLEALKEASKDDEMRVKVVGFTELGIVEVTRKRTSPSFAEKMLSPCAACGGTGRVESAETIAFRLERELMEHRRVEAEAVLVETNEHVANVLLGVHGEYVSTLEELIAKRIIVITNHDWNSYSIKRFGDYQELVKAAEMTS